MAVPNEIFAPYPETVDSGENAQRLAVQVDFLAGSLPLFLFLEFLGFTNCEDVFYGSCQGWLVDVLDGTFLLIPINLRPIVIQEQRLAKRFIFGFSLVVYDEEIFEALHGR